MPRRMLRSRNLNTPWTINLGLWMLLSAVAPIAHGLASIPTARGKAFSESLPPLQPFHRRVYLVRHGQTDWNKAGLMQGGGHDIPLNTHGLAQAAAVANELSGIPLSAVASSHLQRALHTANHVGPSNDNNNECERLVDARFGEMRFGDCEGASKKDEQFQQIQQTMQSNIHMKWPGQDSESIMTVATRGQAAMHALLDRTDDKDHVAVVAHGRFNKILLATLLWNDASRYVDIKQGNTAINVLDYNDSTDVWNAVLLNYSEHAPNDNAKQELTRQQEEEAAPMLAK